MPTSPTPTASADGGYVQMDAVTPPSRGTPSATPPPPSGETRATASGGIEGGPGVTAAATSSSRRGRAGTVTDGAAARKEHGGALREDTTSGYAVFDPSAPSASGTTTADGRSVQTLRRRGHTTASGNPKRWGKDGFKTEAAADAGVDSDEGRRSGSSAAHKKNDDDGDAAKKPVEYAWRARAKTASNGSLDAAVAAAAASSGGNPKHPARKHAHRKGNEHDNGDDGGAADADENLDAPLLVSSTSMSAAGPSNASISGGQSGHPAPRRPSRRSSSDGPGSSNEPTGENGAPPSKGREIVAKIKETSWAVTAEVLDVLPNALASKLFVPDIPGTVLDRLYELQEAMLVPFDHAVRDHQVLIPALWDALCKVRPPLPMAGEMDRSCWRSELWKDYGFQGVDPATDFRGAGLLAARSVIWMCVEEPDISRAMMDGGYPFAIAVINVVMALLHVLHITKGKKTCLDTKVNNANYTAQEARMRLAVMVGDWRCASPTPGLPRAPAGPSMGSDAICSLEDGLMNAVAEACRVLHGEWLRSSRNVMEFNTVLKAAMARFERLLRDRETYIRVSRAIDAKYPEAPLSCAGI